MRIRNFASIPRPRAANLLDLAPRRTVTVPPGDRPFEVELDLAVALESGQIAILTPSSVLLTRGLRPAIGATIVGPADSLRVLRLWVLPADEPVELAVGDPIARLLLLETTAISLFDDAILDDALEPEALTPYAQMLHTAGQPAFESHEED